MTRLTKRKWKNLVMNNCPVPYVYVLAEAERMIDNGETWAPEPVTEADVRAWLYAAPVGPGDHDFLSTDLPEALRLAQNTGCDLRVAVDGLRSAGVDYKGVYYPCSGLSDVARTIAALVYSKSHPDTDVTHLLGEA